MALNTKCSNDLSSSLLMSGWFVLPGLGDYGWTQTSTLFHLYLGKNAKIFSLLEFEKGLQIQWEGMLQQLEYLSGKKKKKKKWRKKPRRNKSVSCFRRLFMLCYTRKSSSLVNNDSSPFPPSLSLSILKITENPKTFEATWTRQPGKSYCHLWLHDH